MHCPKPFLSALLALCLSSLPLLADTPDLTLYPGSMYLAPKPLESPVPDVAGFSPERLGAFVDASGCVLRVLRRDGTEPSPDSKAAACLKQWKFEPVLWEGQPIPFRVEVQFVRQGSYVVYELAPLPNLPCEVHSEDEFGLVKPSLLVDPEPVIPLVELGNRKEVASLIEFVVDEKGIPVNIVPKAASSTRALLSALNVLSGQKYRPATIDGVPVKVAYKQVSQFSSFDRPPEALMGLVDANDPIYPRGLLLAGTEGKATVTYTLDSEGNVSSVQVDEATHPEFGDALAACVESWLYSPEAAAAQPRRSYTHEFIEDTYSGGSVRLARAQRRGEQVSTSGAGLDAKPARIGAGALVIPAELRESGEKGEAMVEFVIDRCGLVQLPAALSASSPRVGAAAVNWVGSMRFKPLTRNGQPTELRLRVPVGFAAQKKAE